MDISALNNSIDMQSLIPNNTKINSINDNAVNSTAEYAKKGEPMYMQDMDTDSDGIVTLDEFRDYCKSKNINTKEMIKMSQMASTFRTMQAETQAIDYISKLVPNVFPKVKQNSAETNHLKSEENKYNISNDKDSENKVSYEKYMEFCENNTNYQNLKSNAQLEKQANGDFKISNSNKAIQSYINNDKNTVKNTFEDFV